MDRAPHILVVDDEEPVTRVLKRTLETADYTVTAVNSGHEALEFLKTSIPDLIILDIKMPGIDGYETLEQIRNDLPIIPVIMLTAVADVSALDKSINLGADDYIRKPFHTAEVIARVKAKLRRAMK
ncbi:MAG: response regulator transcription factor [Dehalococcoidales bacterium]|nr:response regulator transcription factor [Dehalococcoidales bacterium]